MDNFGVSLVKYACPVCGKSCEDGIIMNKVLTESNAEKVKDLHNKTIGYSDHVCEECSKYKENAVFLIEIDPEKSDMKNMETMYRTGKYAAIKSDSKLVKDAENFIIKLKDNTKIIFIDKGIINIE